MAQQSSGPYPHVPEYSIALFDTSHHSAPAHHPPAVPTQTKPSGKVNESFHTPFGSEPSSRASSDRPNKRQKVLEEGNSHKFISQKKWKFSNGQPWLPSKLSSKAQNASGSVTRAKVEPTSPQLRTPLIATPSDPASISHVIKIPIAKNEQGASQRQISRSQPQQSQTGLPSIQATDEEVRLASAAAPNSSSGRLAIPPYSPESNKELHTQSGKRNNLRSGERKSFDAIRTRLAVSASGKSRINSGNGTLCLEKDAKQIAALIAEKRKENESSMFRERLIRRQMQHKSQRDETDIQRNSRASSMNDSDTVLNSRNGYGKPSEFVSGNTRNDAVTSEIPTSYTHTKERQMVQIGQKQRAPRSSNVDEARHVIHSVIAKSTDAPHQASTSSSAPPLISHTAQARHNASSDKKAPAKRLTESSYFQSQAIFDPPPVTTPAQNKAPPFEVEGTHVTTRLIALERQLITKDRSGENQSHLLSNDHRIPQQYYSGHAMSSVSTPLSHNLQRTDSTPSNIVQSSLEMSINAAPSPPNISSVPSPTTSSMQQFANMNLSAQISQSSVYPSIPVYSRPATIDHGSANVTSYYAMNRQTWAFPEQQVDHLGTSQISRTIPRTIAYSHNKASASIRHRSPPLPASNVRKENARSNKQSKRVSDVPKQRVNMFSNTKGTPFPMHEVIRQIEMT